MSNPAISLATGIKTAAQIPLNAKAYFKTLAEMQDLGNNNDNAFIYEKGMIGYCVETNKEYIWNEVDENTPLSITVLPTPFLYPTGVIANGIDYSNKTYNFIEYLGGNELINTVIEGNIFFIQGLTYQSTIINYNINGVSYTVPITSNVLSSSHPTLDRIDLFVLTTNNELTVVEGIPAVNPKEPNIDHTTQLKFQFVIVKAGATTVDQEEYLIYDENLGNPNEWEVVNTEGQANADFTDDSFQNSKSIFIEGGGESTVTINRIGNSVPFVSNGNLVFYIKNTGDWTSQDRITINLYDSSNNITTNLVQINEANSSNFGLEMTGNNTWQLCTIPLSLFTVFNSAVFDRIVISTILADFDIYIDYIRYIIGINNPPVQETQWRPEVVDLGDAGNTNVITYLNTLNPSIQLAPNKIHFIKLLSGNNSNVYIYKGDLPIVIGGNTNINSNNIELLITVGEGTESSLFKGQFTSLANLSTAISTAEAGSFANIDEGENENVRRALWDSNDSIWVLGSVISGGVTTVTGDSVDNTDPENPVVNAIPLSGTTENNPVTGDIEITNAVKIFNANDNISITGKDGITLESEGIAVSNFNVHNGIFMSYVSSLYTLGLSFRGDTNGMSFIFSNTSEFARGITGEQDFTPNAQDLDFIQKKYVNDATKRISRTTSTIDVAPTTTEFVSPVNGNKSIINLNGTALEFWDYTTQWVLDFRFSGGSVSSSVEWNQIEGNQEDILLENFTDGLPYNEELLNAPDDLQDIDSDGNKTWIATAWSDSDEGAFYTSYDNAQTWTEVPTPNNLRPYYIESNRNGNWLATIFPNDNNEILRSDDNGLTWNAIPTNLIHNGQDGKPKTDRQGVWIINLLSEDAIIRSDDDGLTWTKIILGLPNNIRVRTLDTDGNGKWIGTYQNPDNYAVVSLDNGLTWSIDTLTIPFNSSDGNITTNKNGFWICVFRRSDPIALSFDNGATWELRDAISSGSAGFVDVTTDEKNMIMVLPSANNPIVSSDFGKTWKQLNTDPRTYSRGGVATNNKGKWIRSATENNQTVWQLIVFNQSQVHKNKVESFEYEGELLYPDIEGKLVLPSAIKPDGNAEFVFRNNTTENVEPTSTELANPVVGDSVEINLNNTRIEAWIYRVVFTGFNTWTKRYSYAIGSSTLGALYSATTTGTVVLDCNTFDSWYRVLTGNTDFQFNNTPALGKTFVKTLRVIGAFSLTFTSADKVIGAYVDDGTTLNLITIELSNYPTIGLRIDVIINS